MIYLLLYPISLIPLRVLYLFSDFCAYLLYYIFKYHRQAVYSNINESFYYLTYEERIKIEKHYYRSFCDNFIETIKLFSISEKKLKSHITAEYFELQKILDENQNCHIYLGQQFNREWVNAYLSIVNKNAVVGMVYKPLKNRLANDLILKVRTRFGPKMIAVKNMKKEKAFLSDNRHILIFMADQKSFLNSFSVQKSAALNSTGIYAATNKTPIFFANIIRVKRGYYTLVLTPFFAFSKSYNAKKIFSLFAQKLEEAISRNPENYLWDSKHFKPT